MKASFRALIVTQTTDTFAVGVREMRPEELPAGEVLIRVAYSAVNYKDALVCTQNGRVAQTSPLVPGIELTGGSSSQATRVFEPAIGSLPMTSATESAFLSMVDSVNMRVYPAIS
ncbi:MAG TPA: hypothetical protein VF516_26655 [Kofleriaceae bacterium]